MSAEYVGLALIMFAFTYPSRAVGLLAPSTLVGGYLGARLARRLPENVLRAAVVVLGLGVGIYLLVR